MNLSYQRIISESDEDRRGLFAEAARRLGIAEQNVEKDFWVCWILDVLFHGLPVDGPRLLFKGGTSLSKAFRLINRFSEDIDITVFRGDLGQRSPLEELESLSGKKRRARLEAIREACQGYIQDTLRPQLKAVIAQTMRAAGLPSEAASVVPDDVDPDRQTLIFRYPSVVTMQDGFVTPSVRVESGARSALDPHVAATVEPYIASDVPGLNLTVPDVRTIDPKRTFWDKVLIMHGIRRWFENTSELHQDGQRVTRHYYDVHSLVNNEVGTAAVADRALAADCRRHSLIFFGRPNMDLGSAVQGTFALVPTPQMIERMQEDYARMAGMIFGPIPSFEDVIASITDLAQRLNRPAT